MIEQTHCSLCASLEVSEYFKDLRRSYVQCSRCDLVFVPPQEYVTREAEKVEYDLHQNNIDDAGYRGFLSRLMQPLLERLSPGASGLDFGCGPGPALAHMLREAGFEMAVYDSFFACDDALLMVSYDFICATEVIEHLSQPWIELQRLWGLLKPGGYLGLMTKQTTTHAAFANWHYKNDPTHISFFANKTFDYLGQQWGSVPEFIGADVIIFRKLLVKVRLGTSPHGWF